MENLDREMTIQTQGELKTAEQFNALVIRNDGANLVRLRDIGEARVGAEDVRSIGRFNGRPSVALGVVKQTQANTLEVAEGDQGGDGAAEARAFPKASTSTCLTTNRTTSAKRCTKSG